MRTWPDGYRGDVPEMELKQMHVAEILYWMQCVTGSQCRVWRIERMWSEFVALHTSLAAEFWICWRCQCPLAQRCLLTPCRQTRCWWIRIQLHMLYLPSYNKESVSKIGKHINISKRQQWHTSTSIVRGIHPYVLFYICVWVDFLGFESRKGLHGSIVLRSSVFAYDGVWWVVLMLSVRWLKHVKSSC